MLEIKENKGKTEINLAEMLSFLQSIESSVQDILERAHQEDSEQKGKEYANWPQWMHEAIAIDSPDLFSEKTPEEQEEKKQEILDKYFMPIVGILFHDLKDSVIFASTALRLQAKRILARYGANNIKELPADVNKNTKTGLQNMLKASGDVDCAVFNAGALEKFMARLNHLAYDEPKIAGVEEIKIYFPAGQKPVPFPEETSYFLNIQVYLKTAKGNFIYPLELIYAPGEIEFLVPKQVQQFIEPTPLIGEEIKTTVPALSLEGLQKQYQNSLRLEKINAQIVERTVAYLWQERAELQNAFSKYQQDPDQYQPTEKINNILQKLNISIVDLAEVMLLLQQKTTAEQEQHQESANNSLKRISTILDKKTKVYKRIKDLEIIKDLMAQEI